MSERAYLPAEPEATLTRGWINPDDDEDEDEDEEDVDDEVADEEDKDEVSATQSVAAVKRNRK